MKKILPNFLKNRKKASTWKNLKSFVYYSANRAFAAGDYLKRNDIKLSLKGFLPPSQFLENCRGFTLLF